MYPSRAFARAARVAQPVTALLPPLPHNDPASQTLNTLHNTKYTMGCTTSSSSASPFSSSSKSAFVQVCPVVGFADGLAARHSTTTSLTSRSRTALSNLKHGIKVPEDVDTLIDHGGVTVLLLQLSKVHGSCEERNPSFVPRAGWMPGVANAVRSRRAHKKRQRNSSSSKKNTKARWGVRQGKDATTTSSSAGTGYGGGPRQAVCAAPHKRSATDKTRDADVGACV